MRDPEEIKDMKAWLEDEDKAEPRTMPRRGWIWDRDQALEIIDWVLCED